MLFGSSFVVVELIDTILSELILLHMLLSYFLITIEHIFFLDIYRLAHTQGILNNNQIHSFVIYYCMEHLIPKLQTKRFDDITHAET